MNLKVAHLVAVQFGMFVGIMSWLAYSQLPFGEPRTPAEVRKPMAEPVSTFASASNPAEQRSQTLDDSAGQERTQPVAEPPAPAMQHAYSAAAVQQNSALAAQLYYQQIAPRRYARSGLANSSIAGVAPTYAEVAPEPAALQADDPEPETVAYVQPTQVVVYPQPQLVLFSNSRRFVNRCRPAPHARNARTTFAQQRRDRGGLHVRGSTHLTSLNAGSFRPNKSFGVVHRRNDSAPACRPIQGFRPRGHR
jgi:hypothetical protein